MRWASCRTPVVIVAAHVGVTDGKAAQQSSTYVPRSMTARRAGARPVLTARSSIAGFRPSMTPRTSLGATGGLPQDAQAGVLLAGAPAAAGQQPDEERDGQDAHRRGEERQSGEAHPPPPRVKPQG